MHEPWLTASDFNDISFSHEKKGKTPIFNNKCNKFKERIDQCLLIYMGEIGSHFTWRCLIYNGGQRIYERLDRALCSDKCGIRFPSGYAKVLTRVKFYDYYPLLIFHFCANYPSVPPQFRFESAWLIDQTYKAMLQENWKENNSVSHNLDQVKEGGKKWKLYTFDHVLKKKK